MANKAVYWVVAVAGLAVASGAAWWMQNKKASPAAQAVTVPGPQAPAGGGPGGAPGVEVAKVVTISLQDDAQAVGSLRSRQSVTLRPEVAGRIAEIAFRDGVSVRRGQLLVRLDDTLQRAELSQVEAQLSIARANLKRNQELVAENFVAQRVLDESRANLQVAEAQVALARARLERMRIAAPFDGIVGITKVALGEYVKDGADLVNLEDTSALYVDFRLPERYQTRVAPGQSVKVNLDALPGRDFSARVTAVDPLVDANGRALSVRAMLPAEGGSPLRPGMFARVTAVFSVNAAALVVPEEALVPQGAGQVVYKLEPEGTGEAAKTVARRVPVQIGVRRGAQVEVIKGLVEGDTVVVAGQQRLQRDGLPVRVVDLNRAGGKPAGKPGDKPPAAAGGGATPAPAAAPR